MQSVSPPAKITRQAAPRCTTPPSKLTFAVDATKYHDSHNRAHSISISTGYEYNQASSAVDNPDSFDDSDLTELDEDISSVASLRSSSAHVPDARGSSASSPASPPGSLLNHSSSHHSHSAARSEFSPSPVYQPRGKNNVASAEPVARRTSSRSRTAASATKVNAESYSSEEENNGHGRQPRPPKVSRTGAVVNSAASQPPVKDEVLDNSWRKGWLRNGEETAPTPGTSVDVKLKKPVPVIPTSLPTFRRSLRTGGKTKKATLPQDEQEDPTYGENPPSPKKRSSTQRAPKPYENLECPNGCGMVFGRYSDVSRHATYSASCTGGSGQTFPCEYCEKRFTRKDALRRHLRKHHGFA